MGLKIKDEITDFQRSFIATIKARSKKYLGWGIEEIEKDVGKNYDKEKAKSYVSLVLSHALGIAKGGSLNDKFRNSGINIKTIPLKHDLRIKEDMSFRNYDYMKVVNEDWENSKFKKEIEILLLLVHRLPSKDAKKEEAIFDFVLPVIPTDEDIEIMKKDWLEIVKIIKDGNADKLKAGTGKIVHTRPKAPNSKKVIEAPGGYKVVKKCFWIRKDYFQKILNDFQENEDFNDPMIAIDTYEVHENIRVNTKILRVIRDTKITTELKQKYEHRCQICGERITIFDGKQIKYYCEAHHLKPLAQIHDGPDIKENIIILCPNHHVEFDYGVIAIDPNDSQTIVHKDKNNQYNERKIESKHTIAAEFLKYHFDLFIGKIKDVNEKMSDYLK